MKLPTTRKYPKTVLVKDETYRVKFVRKIPGEDLDTQGLCDSGSKTIHIKLGQTRKETFATFIHEVLHAFEFEYRIPLRHRSVYQLEAAIRDFLLSNF